MAAYAVALVVFWPPEGEQPNQAVFLGLMFAPTVGAVLAWAFGGGRILRADGGRVEGGHGQEPLSDAWASRWPGADPQAALQAVRRR